jgi:hypothetical protein
MLRYWLVFCLALVVGSVSAQELEVSVSVNTPTLQLVDPKVFNELESSIQSFMSNQRWTSDVFEQEERIKVSIALTIDQEFSATSFGGELMIQAVRPVYGVTTKHR